MKILCLALIALPLAALAGDEKKKRDFTKLEVVGGTVVCVGCELEKEGADAQCTLYAKHAQGVMDGDGKIWSIVDNGHGHGLITEERLRGREVRVHAWKFAKAQMLDVWEYEAKDGDKWVLYVFCRNCGWEKGEHRESDVCDDCKE